MKLLNKKKLFIFFIVYFIIQVFLAQEQVSNPDEGTHVLIGLFFRDIANNVQNFRSFSDVTNFATNFVVKYPKVTASYPPLYHLLLATILFISESVFLLRIFNILITIVTAFVIYKLAYEMLSDKKIAIISSIFFLSFSTIFFYANMIMMDILQILTFSLVLWYYFKLRKKRTFLYKEIVVFSVLLAVAFLTKFFSIFLPLIILSDSFFHNKKLFKYCMLSLILSLVIISPYLFIFIKFGLYRLFFNIATTPFGSKWEYFDIFSNFGIFIGWFVSISLVWFVWKNIKEPFIITWFIIPLIALLSFADSNVRFSFFLMPLYAIACGAVIKEFGKRFDKNHLFLSFISILIVIQFFHNIYLNYGEVKYPVDDLMKLIEKDGNVLILSENPVYSSVYVLYGYFNDVPGNIIRPCVFEEGNLTNSFLEEWGIRYIVDQENIINNNLKNSLNLITIDGKKIDDTSIRLFERNLMDNVDCNYVCILHGKVCKDDGFNRILELIGNMGSTKSD